MTYSTYRTPNSARFSNRDSGNSSDGSDTAAVVASAAGFGLGLLAAAGRKAVVEAATCTAGD